MSSEQTTVAPSAATTEVAQEESVAVAAPSSPSQVQLEPKEETTEKKPVLPTTVRIAKDSSVRRLTTYCLSRVEAGSVVTIQALTLQVQKAITVASLVRDRLGNVHQVNSLLVVQDSNPEKANRSTSGIQIVLSLEPLNEKEVGYQKPKPKGFAKPYYRRRAEARRQAERQDVKQQTPEEPTAKVTKEAKESLAAPAADKKPQRRRQRRVKSDAEKENPDKNGQEDTKAKPEADAQQKKRQRRNRSRRQSNKPADKKQEVAQEAAPKDPRNVEAKTQQRRNERRGPPRNDRPAEADFDIDYMGRKVPAKGAANRGPIPQGRPYQSRGNPYQYGQSHRYMMDYQRDGRDNYFNRYERDYNPYQGQPRYGGRPAQVGYLPAAHKPLRPDQLERGFDRPQRVGGGQMLGRRGGFNTIKGDSNF